MTRLSRPMSLLLAPTRPDGWWPVVLRVALGAVFVPAGLGKFVNHATYIERFDRWGFPEPGSVAYLVGSVEVLFGLMALIGVAPRLAGLTLAGNMVGAFFTAGLVDGGQNLWLPPILVAASLGLVALGGGRLQLPHALPRRREPADASPEPANQAVPETV